MIVCFLSTTLLHCDIDLLSFLSTFLNFLTSFVSFFLIDFICFVNDLFYFLATFIHSLFHTEVVMVNIFFPMQDAYG